jgi:hypothetical protein
MFGIAGVAIAVLSTPPSPIPAGLCSVAAIGKGGSKSRHLCQSKMKKLNLKFKFSNLILKLILKYFQRSFLPY